MKQLIIGYLVYLPDHAWARRAPLVQQSVNSLGALQNQLSNAEFMVIDNGATANSRASTVDLTIPYTYVPLKQNFFDIAVHMCSYWRALEQDVPYFAYFYDDFIFHDENWVEPAIEFMDNNEAVSCIRLPAYEVNNKRFNVAHTSKFHNPDAVRHEGVRNQQLKQEHIKGNFYTANWRPNSRPTLWRTSEFGKIVDGKKKLPVMQSFEQLLYDYADANPEWLSGFYNGNICDTFPVTTSERTLASDHYRSTFMDVESMKSAYQIVHESP